jgi:hypothetical protein
VDAGSTPVRGTKGVTHLVVQPDCKSGAWRHGRFDPCHTLVKRRTADTGDYRGKHGASGYDAGCRCDTCRDGHLKDARWQRHSRTERLKADPTLAEHGKSSTYINWGCRCELCVQEHNRKVASHRQAKFEALQKDPNAVVHGTIDAYNTWKCRCQLCSKTSRIVGQENYQRRVVMLKANPKIAEHGKEATHVNWGCRCDPCKLARYEARRRREANKKNKPS